MSGGPGCLITVLGQLRVGENSGDAEWLGWVVSQGQLPGWLSWVTEEDTAGCTHRCTCSPFCSYMLPVPGTGPQWWCSCPHPGGWGKCHPPQLQTGTTVTVLTNCSSELKACLGITSWLAGWHGCLQEDEADCVDNRVARECRPLPWGYLATCKLALGTAAHQGCVLDDRLTCIAAHHTSRLVHPSDGCARSASPTIADSCKY